MHLKSIISKQPDIGIDLGNSKFSVCVRGEGVVFSEPCLIAFKGSLDSESSIVAVGHAAREMFERSPSGITVVSPMHDGIVADGRIASLILVHLAKKAGLRWLWSRPKAIVASLLGASEIERKIFIEVAESLGSRGTLVVTEPYAAAVDAFEDIDGPQAHMLIDVGDGATETIIVAMGQPLWGGSIRFGGSHLDTQLIKYLSTHHQLLISRSEAKRLKEWIAKRPLEMDSVLTVPVRGYSLKERLPREKHVVVSELNPVFEGVADRVADLILENLEKAPPEVSADLLTHGLSLCGGASQVLQLKERIADRTHLGVNIMDYPQQTVVRGLYRIVNA
jgi:rod shape-determining protein MreB